MKIEFLSINGVRLTYKELSQEDTPAVGDYVILSDITGLGAGASSKVVAHFHRISASDHYRFIVLDCEVDSESARTTHVPEAIVLSVLGNPTAKEMLQRVSTRVEPID